MTAARPSYPLLGLATLYAEAAYEDAAGFAAMVKPGEGDGVDVVSVVKGGLDVQAYIHTCHTRKLVVVAVRGTETRKWADWLQNFKLRGTHPVNRGLGRVHRGFLAEAVAIAKPVCAAVYRMPGYQLLLTGHSKGGSICTVLQHVYSLRGTCHTFGEARCLGRKAAGLFNASYHRHTRWVNTIDPVPKLLWWRYRHVGQLVYLDRRGKWNHGYSGFWDRLLVRIRNPFGAIGRHSMSGYRAYIARGLKIE